MLGILQIFAGNRAEGRRLLEDAIRRDPLNPLHSYSRANISWSLFLDGEYETVLALARQAIHLAPHGHLWAYRHVAAALAELNRLDEASTALRVAQTLHPKAFDSYVETRVPWQRPEDHQRMLDALRKAGWQPRSGA